MPNFSLDIEGENQGDHWLFTATPAAPLATMEATELAMILVSGMKPIICDRGVLQERVREIARAAVRCTLDGGKWDVDSLVEGFVRAAVAEKAGKAADGVTQ